MASIASSLSLSQVGTFGPSVAPCSTTASSSHAVVSFASSMRGKSLSHMIASAPSAVAPSRRRQNGHSVRATVATGVDATSFTAKDMERVAAKEALLLAIKDAGGVESLSSGKGNSAGKIEVSGKMLALERLNPTPRPTTSPLLEGTWDFVWAGTRSPGAVATRTLLKRFPEQLASLESLQIEIFGNSTKATASLKFLSAAETSITVTTRLAMEGTVKLKEEYVEAVVSTPVVADDNIPAALKGIFDQVASATSSLPAAIKDAVAAGLKVPLNGRYERELIISYLDEEFLVARDQSGLADVLVRAVTFATPLDGEMTEIDVPTQ